MPYVVAATLRVKQKHLAEFTRRIKRHAQNSIRRETECIGFEVSIDKDDPRRFLFYEVYTDEAAFEAHMRYPHMTKHMQAVGPMLDGKVELVGFCHRVAAPNK